MKKTGNQLYLYIGASILALVILTAILSPIVSPYDPAAQNTAVRLVPPMFFGGDANHVFGTDPLGRDLLSRVLFGSRVSLIIGLAAVFGAGLIGVTLGIISGFFGGALDRLIMRLVDIQLAIPFLVLAIAVLAALGPSLQNLIIVLIINGWVVYARVARAEVLALKNLEYVGAAGALGARTWRILRFHIVPALLPTILIIATVQVGTMILMEASLSFLGLGVPPEIPSWGSIAADGRAYITTSWWVTAAPGIAIFLCVIGINYLGEWARDSFDPKSL